MVLINLYNSPADWMLTYRLLGERKPHENISHRAMPTWNDHCSFILSRPYQYWYVIIDEGETVGAIYLTEAREIGVGVLKTYRGEGLATAAIQELMRLHPGRFLANINPANFASIALFRKLGFGPEPIQITLEKAA